jgi:hypothetical protein
LPFGLGALPALAGRVFGVPSAFIPLGMGYLFPIKERNDRVSSTDRIRFEVIVGSSKTGLPSSCAFWISAQTPALIVPSGKARKANESQSATA